MHITSAPSGATEATSAVIEYAETAGSWPTLTTRCALDGSPAATPCDATQDDLSGLALGHHSFTVTVTDGNGLTASASA